VQEKVSHRNCVIVNHHIKISKKADVDVMNNLEMINFRPHDNTSNSSPGSLKFEHIIQGNFFKNRFLKTQNYN